MYICMYICIYIYMYIFTNMHVHFRRYPGSFLLLYVPALLLLPKIFAMQKQGLEPYGQRSIVTELYIEANEDPGFRSEHEDYQGCYLFLHWLAYAITLILDAQKTGQIFCVGVYGNFYVGVKVEAAFLLPYVKTLSDLSSDRRLVAEAAAAIYNWLGRKSDLRALLNLLGQGGFAFYATAHHDKMIRRYISEYGVTEGDFVELWKNAVDAERLLSGREGFC